MQPQRPARVIDPVCGMTVDVAGAEAHGLLVELDGRTYAFCGRGCRRAFETDPAEFTARAEAAEAAAASGAAQAAETAADSEAATASPRPQRPLPIIDEGMRRWYESCSCCLSEAYPEIKAQLDAEHAAAH